MALAQWPCDDLTILFRRCHDLGGEERSICGSEKSYSRTVSTGRKLHVRVMLRSCATTHYDFDAESMKAESARRTWRICRECFS